MSRILSQDEIDSLLQSGGGTSDSKGRRSGSHGVVGYNFRRPDRISKEQLRSLHLLHDRFAVNVATSLSAFLRSMTEVTIVSVEQFAYSEFVMSLPDPTAYYALSMQPIEGHSALEVNPTVAFTMVDRMLGGTGLTLGPNRALTEIEQNVMDSVVKLLLDSLSEAWRPVTEVQFKIHGRETRPQMLQVTGPNEIVILVAFDLRVAEARGMLNLCIPASAIESVGDRFAQGWQRASRQPTADEESWLSTNLGRVTVPVTAMLGTTLSANELLKLQPGDVIALGHSATQPIDVQVGEVSRFRGRLASDGQTMSVRVESRTDSTRGASA